MYDECILFAGELVTRAGDVTDEEKLEPKKKGATGDLTIPNQNQEMLVCKWRTLLYAWTIATDT